MGDVGALRGRAGHAEHRAPAVLTKDAVVAQARGLGFTLVGVTRLGPAETAPAFERWLEAGFGGTMSYLSTGAEKRSDTRLPLPGALGAIVVGLNYGGTQPPGAIARYARGDDYHDVMTGKLNALHRWLSAALGRDVRGKAYVDTGPVLERDLARRAGLGWFGKNTMLINPRLGSYFFLGALLVDLDLDDPPLTPDAPFEADRCGSCTRCLDACPTGALVAPRVLDATRCISYLTIELKGSVPEPLRPLVGELVYGCDICQDVCPWNVRFARDADEPAFWARSGAEAPDLRELLLQDEDTFRTRFRKSPVKRAKRRGLARNAAVALGNRGDPDDLPALRHAAEHDPDAVVREHAQWAIEQIERSDSRGDADGGA